MQLGKPAKLPTLVFRFLKFARGPKFCFLLPLWDKSHGSLSRSWRSFDSSSTLIKSRKNLIPGNEVPSAGCEPQSDISQPGKSRLHFVQNVWTLSFFSSTRSWAGSTLATPSSDSHLKRYAIFNSSSTASLPKSCHPLHDDYLTSCQQVCTKWNLKTKF